MSYLALARKYRPQNFEEVVAQDFTITALKNALELGKTSHAYILGGPKGVGKTTIARIFAKALNCTNREGANPCNECDNCVAITEGSSIDVIEIDGASNGSVDKIRQLREMVNFMPARSKYKVYIIDEVHMLSTEAFNAILKTLEEPPEFAVFILATTDVHKIPATVVSRCQTYSFKNIGQDEIVEQLKHVLKSEKISYEEGALEIIAKLSTGGLRDALSILDQIVAFSNENITLDVVRELLSLENEEKVQEIFKAVFTQDKKNIIKTVDEIDNLGFNYKSAIEGLIEMTRNLMIFYHNPKLRNITKDEKKLYSELVSSIKEEQVYAVFQILLKAFVDIKTVSFERYIFEFALYKSISVQNLILGENIIFDSRGSQDRGTKKLQASKPEKLKDEAFLDNHTRREVEKGTPNKFLSENGSNRGKLSKNKQEPEKIKSQDSYKDNNKDDDTVVFSKNKKVLDRLVAQMNKIDAILATHLANGAIKVFDVKEKAISIKFDRDARLSYNEVIKADNHKKLQDFLVEKIGEGVEVLISLSDNNDSKEMESKLEETAKQDRDNKKKEILESPNIKNLISQFGVKETEIKVDLQENETNENKTKENK